MRLILLGAFRACQYAHSAAVLLEFLRDVPPGLVISGCRGDMVTLEAMDDGFIWRAAEVTFSDWNGTAQLDQRRSADLAELAGLDSQKWLIVGFDIGGGENGHDLRVVAVHRDLIPEAADVFPKIAAEHGGEIPATEFLVHDVEPYEVLQAITHRFELRMRARGTRDLPIRIISQFEGPEQPLV